MNYTWRYYRILSYISFFSALYYGYEDNVFKFYEFGAFALFCEIKDHLQQIENKIKSE
jgi:hypothetical protein